MNGGYRNKRVLITGGLGFIGSNLALRLTAEGAQVTVIDSRVPGCGANGFNLLGSRNITVMEQDIGSEVSPALLRQTDIIFNLAGEVSHVHSMLFPERDARINAGAHARFLDQVVKVRPGVRVVYASTRQIYGVPQALPVDETHPVNPVDFNGIHKYAAEQYHLLLTRMGQMDAVVLRLTNVYGPRMAIALNCQGFLPVFTSRALSGLPIDVFGDGEQLRDPLYVDDACEAFLKAGALARGNGKILNIGSPEVVSLMQIAQEFASQAGLPEPRRRPFPHDRKRIDIGSYCTCIGSANEQLGWMATTSLREGIGRTLEYFHAFSGEYVHNTCPLEHLREPAHAS